MLPFPTTSTITILFLEKTKICIHMDAAKTLLLIGPLVLIFCFKFSELLFIQQTHCLKNRKNSYFIKKL